MFRFLSEDYERSGLTLEQYLESVRVQVEQFKYDQLNR